ncbi:unnamed protein product [Citrullus colocynthis]|uniref:Uncharacterized protein n=1 Tax=Citrullus colocynthis TaxID=252529 RepID=A0ABP0XT88_9ROSI
MLACESRGSQRISSLLFPSSGYWPTGIGQAFGRVLNSVSTKKGEIEGIEERGFLLEAPQWRFTSPGPPHHGRWNYNGLDLIWGSQITVLELEWSNEE